MALTLKIVAGLSTAEIARAFLVSESTMSQRLLRTKQKISNAAIPYRVPAGELLAERTSGVLVVLYLIFNAGYGRPEDHLAAEALHLVALLVDLMPGDDEARGLLALVSFQMARRATRFDARGDLVPMEEQDRSRWDAALMRAAHLHLRHAQGVRQDRTGCRRRSLPAMPRQRPRRPPPGAPSSTCTTRCSPPSRHP